MSAFVVSREHVDVLVTAALNGPSGRAVSPNTAWNSFTWYAREWSDCDAPEEFYAGHRRLVEHDSLKGQPGDVAPSELGELLWSENVASVRYRYADADESGMVGQDFYNGYEYTRPACKLSGVAILKAIDCLEYQSCEHPDWQTSEARTLCNVLRDRVISTLPGYDDAPWEWDATKITEQHRRDTMPPAELAALEAQEKAESDAITAAHLRAYTE